MEESDFGKYERLFTQKVKAGKRRTYFMDIMKTRASDYYITITESTKRFHGDGYERHKIFLYKEDFNRFVEGLQGTIDRIKNDLLPDYDYDEYGRREEEWKGKEDNNRGQDGQEDQGSDDLDGIKW